MSPDHVAAMNALLADSEPVRAACTVLTRPATVGYRLANGPHGETVHWSVEIADTVRFSLGERPADVVLVGDWAQVIRATTSARANRSADPGLTVEGDQDLLPELMSVIGTARSVATLPVEFPQVPAG